MRLIDADALKRNFEANTPVFAQDLVSGICAIIDRARTIDAVQVIRCKDCKCKDKYENFCRRFLREIDPSDYCSYAEGKG